MIKDLTGQKFGRLEVVGPTKERNSRRAIVWLCRCLCGNTHKAVGGDLQSAKIVSCGCYRKERARTVRITHGHSVDGKRSTELESFTHAKQRCINPKNKDWGDYGGRGIKFLFTSFEQFLAELGPKPLGLTLDRINNSGNYEPGNVQWATSTWQRLNSRRPTR